MQHSVLTAGIFGDFGFEGLLGTIVIAPAGQWRAQLPHSTPSVSGMQFFFTQTAWPICVADLAVRVMGLMAPVGQTLLHRVHPGWQ